MYRSTMRLGLKAFGLFFCVLLSNRSYARPKSIAPDDFNFRVWLDQNELNRMALPAEFSLEEIEWKGARYVRIENIRGTLLLPKKEQYSHNDIKQSVCENKAKQDLANITHISGVSSNLSQILTPHANLIGTEIIRKCARNAANEQK